MTRTPRKFLQHLVCITAVLALTPGSSLFAENQADALKQLNRQYTIESNSLKFSTNRLEDASALQEEACVTSPIPTVPVGPTVERNYSWFDEAFEMTAWRFPCNQSFSNVIITINPTSPSTFICSSQLTLVQDGVQSDREFVLLQDPERYLGFCGNIYVTTSFILTHHELITPQIDIQQSFDIFWDLGNNTQQFTMFAYNPGDYGGKPPPEKLSNDAGVNGLFYDPANSGHGFDVVRHEDGLVVYYYGHTASGERLWLISDNFQGDLDYNQPFEITLFEILNGTFGQPKAPVSTWGAITMEFSSCDSGRAVLNGIDGNIAFDFVRLAGIPGVSCE